MSTKREHLQALCHPLRHHPHLHRRRLHPLSFISKMSLKIV